jgi:hypothetical protein
MSCEPLRRSCSTVPVMRVSGVQSRCVLS